MQHMQTSISAYCSNSEAPWILNSHHQHHQPQYTTINNCQASLEVAELSDQWNGSGHVAHVVFCLQCGVRCVLASQHGYHLVSRVVDDVRCDWPKTSSAWWESQRVARCCLSLAHWWQHSAVSSPNAKNGSPREQKSIQFRRVPASSRGLDSGPVKIWIFGWYLGDIWIYYDSNW